jgi:3-hydroxyisobutyrate dehydrogenase-like beta-hydroxyacid dehydrogenase
MWASDGRGSGTMQRARDAGLDDVETLPALVVAADVIFSICPPHAAVELAGEIGEFDGSYVDANAVSPATAREVGDIVTKGGARFVDGGIIGNPPSDSEHTSFCLAGPDAAAIAALFDGTSVDARVVGTEIGAASALKMAYAGWTKGRMALLLTMREYAESTGVGEALEHEWSLAQPGVQKELESARRAAETKGWRWKGEMDEIAESLGAVHLPTGFHEAAAAVYDRYPRLPD